MLYVWAAPRQAFKTGVTVMDETIATVSTLIAVNDGTEPIPELVSPMVVSLLFHKKVAPNGELVKLVIGVIAPLHIETAAGGNTVGLGFTAMVKLLVGPTQPANTGLTETVAVCKAELALVAVKAAMAPVPLLASPIEVWVLVQLKLAPEGVLLKDIGESESPLQTESAVGTTAKGVGLTVIVKLPGAPVQPFSVGVLLIVDTSAAVVVLLAIKFGKLAFPEAARPMFELLLVHVKLAPEGVLLKVAAVTEEPAQVTIELGIFSKGVGLTVIV